MKWIKLFMKFTYKFKCKNLISIDEKDWKISSRRQMTFWPRGHTRYGTTKQQRKITLLAAISVWGLEYFTLIKGGVNMLIFT